MFNAIKRRATQSLARAYATSEKESEYVFQTKVPVWDPNYRFHERAEAYTRIGKAGWNRYMRTVWHDQGRHPAYPYPWWDEYLRTILANSHYLVLGASLGYIGGQWHWDHQAVASGKIVHPLDRPIYDWDEITQQASKLTTDDVSKGHH